MPAKLHRCVAKVMAQGKDEDAAYAICQSSINRMSERPTDSEVELAMLTFDESKHPRHETGPTKMSSLSTLTPSDIVIVLERSDGSGVVELPVLAESARIDLGRTASGRAGEEAITAEDLRSAVANLAHWPGPIPIHRAPHRSMTETSGPGDGFLESLEVRGKQLWARLDLTKPLFQEVKARQWRGFSVDYGRGARLATKTLTGFLIAGGVFTNRPAADVHFKVAAGVELNDELSSYYVPFSDRGSDAGGDDMAENQDVTVQLATAEAEVKSKATRIVQLEENLADARESINSADKAALAAERRADEAIASIQAAKLSSDRHKADLDEANERIVQLEEERKDLRTKLATMEATTIGSKISSLCRAAVKEGVQPSRLKAFGDYEKDPVKWLNDNFKSLESAEIFIKTLPRDAALGSVPSGREKPDATDTDGVITPENANSLRRLGLNPDYASVTTESAAEEVRAKLSHQSAVSK